MQKVSRQKSQGAKTRCEQSEQRRQKEKIKGGLALRAYFYFFIS